MNPLPGVPDGEKILPDFLTLDDPTRAEDVARSRLIAGNWLTIRLRQYLAVAYLAHTGIFIDNEGRIKFDVTDPEAVAFLCAHTEREWASVEREREILSGHIDEDHSYEDPSGGRFMDYPFVRFNRYRECRNDGTDHEPAFRLYPQLLDPVTEMR